MGKVLFSGTRPSGSLTIGNYLGAMTQWKKYEADYESLFCVVDLHVLSEPTRPDELRDRTLEVLCLYVACGLDPDRSIIFAQSQNPHHAELAWILFGSTACGDLTRMTQFKDKSGKTSHVTAGLLSYPVLMASDILLYQTDVVPVGDDQVQHVELCRGIARRFNSDYGTVFTIPESLTPSSGGRVRSLGDPSRKMDKSDTNARNIIKLLDSADEVRTKLRKAKTDSTSSFAVDDPDEGIANLVMLMALTTDTSVQSVLDQYRPRGYGALKTDLADAVIELLTPIQRRYAELREDEEILRGMMRTGAERAVERSEKTIRSVRHACGLAAGGFGAA